MRHGNCDGERDTPVALPQRPSTKRRGYVTASRGCVGRRENRVNHARTADSGMKCTFQRRAIESCTLMSATVMLSTPEYGAAKGGIRVDDDKRTNLAQWSKDARPATVPKGDSLLGSPEAPGPTAIVRHGGPDGTRSRGIPGAASWQALTYR